MLFSVAERGAHGTPSARPSSTLVAFGLATAIAHRGIAAAIPALLGIAAL